MEMQAALTLVPTKSRVRITEVDDYGFTGRDVPPTRHDVGRMCTVLEIVPDDYSEPGQEEFVIVKVVPDGQPGRQIELVNHEFEESC